MQVSEVSLQILLIFLPRLTVYPRSRIPVQPVECRCEQFDVDVVE
jgi:hypothetical protein